MSQKTNPLSLRLQKENRYFSSPWFSDLFFSENYHHQLEIEEYINKLLQQTQYSRALLSIKKSYRRSSAFFFLQDFRADRKEKQLSFRLREKGPTLSTSKSSISPFLQKINSSKAKIVTLLKTQEQLFKGYHESLPFIFFKEGREETKFSSLQVGTLLEKKKIETRSESEPSFIKKGLQSKIKKLRALPAFKDKKRFSIEKVLERENNKKQPVESHLLSLLSLRAIAFKEKGEIAKNKLFSFSSRAREGTMNKVPVAVKRLQVKPSLVLRGDLLFSKSLSSSKLFYSFKKQIRDTFLKSKQNYTFVNTFLSSTFFDFFLENLSYTSSHSFALRANSFTGQVKKDSFYKNESNLKELWQSHLKEKVTKNNCLSFCEKVVEELPFSALSDSGRKLSLPYFTFSGREPKRIENDLLCQQISPTYLSLSENEKAVMKIERNGGFLTSLFPIVTYFEPIRFISDTQNAVALLDTIVALLEKRVAFQQIKSKVFRDISKKREIKGIKIACSGRLGGRSKKAQKAKLQSYQWGEISLNAFSSKVLFESKSAHTLYGKVGVKIWLSFEELSLS